MVEFETNLEKDCRILITANNEEFYGTVYTKDAVTDCGTDGLLRGAVEIEMDDNKKLPEMDELSHDTWVDCILFAINDMNSSGMTLEGGPSFELVCHL